jgi:hypothetical protein
MDPTGQRYVIQKTLHVANYLDLAHRVVGRATLR